MSIVLTTVSSGYNLSAINSNFQALQEALNSSILWRTGNVAGETLMTRDIDMNGHTLLNLASDPNNPGSILTVEVADARYYNVSGDTLEGDMNAGQHQIKNLAKGSSQYDAVRKKELDDEEAARQGADANIQEQLTGNVPLEASAFSEISWHSQEILNSVNIPANKNAWSFGPQMEIEQGQAVTIGEGSSWTVASGRVVENEDLHALIADTLTTSDNAVTKNVATLVDDSEFSPLAARVGTAETNISSLQGRMTAEETKVQPILLGGTGNTTGLAASATQLATARTLQTNLASTTATNFDGTANNVHGVTGILPIANGGTGNTTNLAASATVLATGRTIQTNLASTTAPSFNGSANITPGVTGVLPIANGGTGQSTVAYLHALAGASTQSILQTTWTKLTPASSIDTLTSYSAGNYTVPSTGYYHLRAACRIGAASATDTWAMKFDVSTGVSGSATQGQATKGGLSTEVIAQVDCILSLTAGATISAYAYQTSSTVTTFSDATISIIRVA